MKGKLTMEKIKRIALLSSIFMLTTMTNIFAETGMKVQPKLKWSEILLGIGVGVFVASVIKTVREGKKTKSTGMYDNKGAKVPPMKTKKKKKKK